MKAPLTIAILALTACASDSSGGDDRGGPDALTGVGWHTTFEQNGINFDFSFAFDNAKVTATNKCSVDGQSLTATTAAMVKYRYDANIPKAGHGGTDACFVDVASGKFSFEIAGDKLIMTANGQTVTFTQAPGSRSGLYGDWTAMQNGFEITWSMGGGKIRATAKCPSGSASTEVSADFTNFVDILEDKSQTEGDDSFNCNVGISKAMAEYHFDGDDLVMNVGGKSITFHR